MNMRETTMTERELRLCVEGTLSEAALCVRAAESRAKAGDGAYILEMIVKAEGELARAKSYVKSLATVT